MSKSNKLSFVLLICSLLSSCQTAWRQPFPDAKIVFQAGLKEESKLGFVNPDGSKPTIIEVEEFFGKPTWSSNGQGMYGLGKSNKPAYSYGFPAYWEENGTFKKCEKWGNFAWVESFGNPANPMEVLIQDSRKILLVDLSSCKLIEEIAEHPGQGYMELEGISYKHDSQKLLFGLQLGVTKATYQIMEIDLQTGQTRELGNGINPSWSPDGSQIAYVQADGIYVMDADGSGSRRVVDINLSDLYGDIHFSATRPSWSPDGQWIVYHRCEREDCWWSENTIFIAEIATGREVKVVEGGAYPDWRK